MCVYVCAYVHDGCVCVWIHMPTLDFRDQICGVHALLLPCKSQGLNSALAAGTFTHWAKPKDTLFILMTDKGSVVNDCVMSLMHKICAHTHTHKFLLPWGILCHPKPLFPCLSTRSTLSSSSTSFHCRVALHCSNTSLSITDILVGWMLPHVLTTFAADQGW